MSYFGQVLFQDTIFKTPLVPAARAYGACFVMNMSGYLAGVVKRNGIKLGYRTVSIYVFKLA